MRSTKRFIKVCPKCGSENIGLPNLNSLIYRKGLVQPTIETGMEVCKECGYHGIMIKIERKYLSKFKKKYKSIS